MRRLILATCILVFTPAQLLGTPLTAEGESRSAGRSAQSWIPLSAEALVLSDARLEMAADLGVLGSQTRGTDPRAGEYARRGGWPGEQDAPWTMDVASSSGGTSIRDVLRSYVNVERGSPSAEHAPERRRGPQGEALGLAGVDIGPVANEWIQDTLHNILDSALRLDADDKGRVSFSVLGLGEFGINLSGNRSEIALTTGDTVLLSAQRVPPPPGTGGGSVGYGSPDWQGGGGGRSNVDTPPAMSPLRQAIELMLEIASHPLSLLVYALIAIYGLIWSVLSRRSRAIAVRSRRPRTSEFTSLPTASSADPSAPAGRRKRRRRHRARTSTHRA